MGLRTLLAFGLGSSVILVGACSSSGSTKTIVIGPDAGTADAAAAPALDTPEGYCDAAATYECLIAQTCDHETMYATPEACAADHAQQCKTRLALEGALLPEGCAFPATLADCTAASRDYPEACRIKGTHALDAACKDDAQCASGFCADYPCGKCRNPIADGGACSDQSGSACRFPRECIDSVCQLPFPAGHACTSNFGCDSSTTHCVTSSHTCVAYLAEGASCVEDAFDDPCGGGVTARYCVRGTCAVPAPIAEGKPCGLDHPGSCVLGTACVSNHSDFMCQKVLPIGAACVKDGTPICEIPAECVNGVCAFSSECN